MQDSFFVCQKFYNDNFQNQLDKQLLRGYILHIVASPSSRGLGHRVLIPATWVRIPLEMPVFCFFPSIGSQSRKKQFLTSANLICSVRIFSFCFNHFLLKNGIAHLSIGLRSRCSRSSSLRSSSNPIGDASLILNTRSA